MNKKKALVVSVISIVILFVCIGYINKHKLYIYINQMRYTSPLTWKTAILHFDKTNIIFEEDVYISIHSLLRPEMSAVSIIDSEALPTKAAIEAQESDGRVVIDHIYEEQFKGLNSTVYMATETQNGLLIVHRDLPSAKISIRFYGKKEDYPFFKNIIDAIEIIE